MEKRETTLCPSARCEPGASLLGVIQPSGRVAFLPPGLGVDEEFSRLAGQERFRYSSRCVGSCVHWQGRRCTALDQVRAHLAPYAETTTARCSIRPECRWHQQAGDAACAVCPLVTTDLMVLEEVTEAVPVAPAPLTPLTPLETVR